MYRLLRSARLFYRKLVGNLERARFKLNACDLCVVNKTVIRSQVTVC